MKFGGLVYVVFFIATSICYADPADVIAEVTPLASSSFHRFPASAGAVTGSDGERSATVSRLALAKQMNVPQPFGC